MRNDPPPKLRRPRFKTLRCSVDPWLFGHLRQQASRGGMSVTGYVLKLLKADHARALAPAVVPIRRAN